MQFNPFATFATATVITACTMPAIIHRLKQSNQLDVPNDRSMHTVPIPRGGGIAIAAVASILGLVSQSDRFSLVTICAAGSLAAVGYRDDNAGLAPKTRLLLQFLVGAVAAGFLVANMTGGIIWIAVFYGGATCWIAAYVNAFNFMDGINGISAVQCIVAGAAFAWMGHEWGSGTLQVLGIIISGCALGFVPFNFPHARAYLGDVGSYFCGAWLASLLVVALRSGVPFLIAVSPLALYLVDTSTTIVKRIRLHESLSVAHKSHAFQRIAELTQSHAVSTLIVGVAILSNFAIAIQIRDASFIPQVISVAICGAVLSAYALLPSVIERVQMRMQK